MSIRSQSLTEKNNKIKEKNYLNNEQTYSNKSNSEIKQLKFGPSIMAATFVGRFIF